MVRESRVASRNGVVAVLVATIAAGCASPSPTVSPSTGRVSPAVTASSPAATPGPGESGTAAPTSQPPFDPATVSVGLETYAHVEGGPLAFAAPADGSGRLFIASQDGRIWIVTNGATGATPMLDIGGRITSGGERGLLGIAVHPGFPSDPRVFVDYTDRNGNTVVSSFSLVPGDGSRLDADHERIVFTTTQPFANHNGGALLFGPDGYLYISLGDGGGGGDPQGNGQRRDTTLGKILRIDVDHAEGGRQYAIPSDNPFATDPRSRGEIWLYGLRNPWRMSFDRETGNLWIGDVGQNAWEEVDVVPAATGGLNFGWNVLEGTHCYQPARDCSRTGLTLPIAEYGHDAGCTVIGGYVYRGTRYPMLRGGYVFADYCTGTIWAIPATAASLTKPVKVGSTGVGISAFGEDQAGELYLANLDGTISRLTAVSR